MAHRLSLRKRRSTTTAIFLLPFCENAFFMKESPPQTFPPASPFVLQRDKYVEEAGDLGQIFPRLIPIALAAVYSKPLGLCWVYERAALTGFYELLMAARLHPLTGRIWLLLFVSAHSHCTACNRGQRDRGDCLPSTADFNVLATSEKSRKRVIRITRDWTCICRRHIS